MNFKKTTAKVLSMVMCLALLFTVCAPAVSAAIDEADKPVLNYVSLGDSMTNGYCFDGYQQTSKDRAVYDLLAGIGVYGEDAYPLQFEEHLSKNYKVNHSKLAVSGMLTEDLLYLLGGCDEVDHGWAGYRDYVGTYTDTELMAHYQEKVKEAHVITLCIGNAAFGAYLVQMLTDIMGVFGADYEPGEDVSLEGALALVESEKLKEMVRDIYDEMKEIALPAIIKAGFEDKAELIFDQIAYTVASFLASYDRLLDRIVELNPDVDIILVGLFNAMGGLNLTVTNPETNEEEPIPFKECMTAVYGALNAYIAGIPAMKKATGELNYADADFYYAEQPEAEYIFEAFDELAGNNWGVVDRLKGDTVRQRTLDAYNGNIRKMVGEAFNVDLPEVTLDHLNAYTPDANWDVEYEGIRFNTVTYNDRLLLSIIMYLSIEEALIKSAEVDTLSMSDILAISGDGLVDVFFEVGDIVNPGLQLGNEFGNQSGEHFEAYVEAYMAMQTAKGNLDAVIATNPSDYVAITAALEEYEEKTAAYEKLIADYNELASAKNAKALFTEFFCRADILPLCKIFLLFKAGDGMSVHPTPACHDKIVASVINAYDNKHTVFAETLNNGKIIAELIFENYKEIYAFVYDYADKIGLVDDITANVDTYLNNTLAALEAAEKLAKEYSLSDEFTAQAIATAASARTTIEAIRTLIKNADELDDETLANAVALIATLENTLVDLANLINIAVEDGVVYATPYVQEALAYLNVKVNEALVALEELNAKCQVYAAKAKEIIAYLLSAGENYVKDFLSNSAFDADYTVSKDSYILAIGSDTAYAALLAEKLGLGKNQFGTMAWDNLDSSIIAKADLITVGYDTAKFASFTIDQVVAYVTDYVNVDLRNDANAYVEAAIKHLFAEVPFVNTKFVEGIIADVKAELNTTIDEILGNEMIPEATATDFDWAALVGEENVAKIESMIDSIVAEIEATGALDAVINDIEGVEDGKIKIEVAKLFLESVDEDVLAIINAEDVEALFGDYANYEIELPVYEVVALAIESYFYSYIQFNIEYAQTVYAINVINPDAKVVLLSGYNAFDGNGFDLVIGDIVIDLDTILTPELKDVAESFIDDAYTAIFDTVDSAIDVENVVIIEKVLEAFENYVDLAIAEIKNVQGEIAAIDVVEIIKSFEIPEIELAAIVGEENVAYAQRLINVVKFALTESDIYDAVMAEIPVAEDIQNVLLALYAKLAAGVEGLDDLAAIGEEKLADLFVELELSIPAVRDMLADLAVYVEVIKEYSVDLKAILGDLYDKVAAETITIKGTSIDLGDIFGDVVPGTTSIHSLVYAFSMKNVIFVDVSEVETLGDELSMVEYILTYIYDRTITGATEAGLAYIAEQIYNALNVTCDHADDNKDHACDFCGANVGEHVDANKDHKCDYGCSVAIGEHVDADKDHKCDYGCSVAIGDHADADKDHKCDYCQAEMTKHVDENKDHKCDNGCSVAIGDHVDADKDHKCDYGCSEAIGDHADANKDHNCDYGCSEKIGSHTEDANKDHNCDYCGAKISECTWGEWVVTTEATKRHDGEEQRTCSYCGAVETRVIPEIPGLTAIAVVGIVLGSAVVVGGIGFAVYFFVFKKKVSAK